MSKIEKSSEASRALIREFFSSYPEEAARNLNDFPVQEKVHLLRDQPFSTVVAILVQLDPDRAVELVQEMDDEFFRQSFAMMDPNRGAALLARLEKETLDHRLSLLSPVLSREYRELMTYPPESAGYLMDPRVTTFHPDRTVEDALNQIRAIRERKIMDLCLVDEEGRLVGVIPLQEVAVSQPRVRLRELVRARPIGIQAMSPREEVVQLLEERRLSSLPVVDIEERLLGIIRYDTLVTAAQHDASEDIQAMFGAGREERALSKVSLAVRKRLPWLEINLATAFLAAAVVGLFEETIAKITALAVLLPVVAGQSGNTGSQALAVTMRGLALREIRIYHWPRIARKEILTGFFNGCAVAGTTSLVVYLWMHSTALPLVIGTSMILSMVIAGLAGAVIPMMLKAFGQDPAQSSSIILTTVTDVVGFMSFLGLAKLFSNLFPIA